MGAMLMCVVVSCVPNAVLVFLTRFLRGDGLAIQRPPRPGDVGQDCRDDERDYSHGFERKDAGAAVGNGERALQRCHGGVIGGVVPAGTEQ